MSGPCLSPSLCCGVVLTLPVLSQSCGVVLTLPVPSLCCGVVLTLPVLSQCCGVVLTLPVLSQCCGVVLTLPVLSQCCGVVLTLPVLSQCCGVVLTLLVPSAPCLPHLVPTSPRCTDVAVTKTHSSTQSPTSNVDERLVHNARRWAVIVRSPFRAKRHVAVQYMTGWMKCPLPPPGLDPPAWTPPAWTPPAWAPPAWTPAPPGPPTARDFALQLP